MLPVVFTPSTLGKRMHFGLTSRVSVLTDEAAAGCAELFSSALISAGNG
jgi:hypothetical protein